MKGPCESNRPPITTVWKLHGRTGPHSFLFWIHAYGNLLVLQICLFGSWGWDLIFLEMNVIECWQWCTRTSGLDIGFSRWRPPKSWFLTRNARSEPVYANILSCPLWWQLWRFLHLNLRFRNIRTSGSHFVLVSFGSVHSNVISTFLQVWKYFFPFQLLVRPWSA